MDHIFPSSHPGVIWLEELPVWVRKWMGMVMFRGFEG